MTDTSAIVALVASIGAVWAVVVLVAAKLIERRNPPMGSFVEAEDVTFHYLERGRGPNVVFLHGNATMLQDFVLSDAFTSAAAHCRAIAFDRPGFGYSTRPLTRLWTPTAQADLLAKALRRLDCEQAVIVGHSWGTLTALALAQRHPELVRALVLLSGFYYPRPRFDALLAAAGAIPVLGDILRYTLMPLAGLLMLPLVRRNLFAPAAVPEHFRRRFPWLMTLRPWQLRASLADGALMPWSAALLAEGYRGIRVPTFIAAGAEDRIVDTAAQSERLVTDLLHSRLDLIEGVGHMIQHSAPERVIAAINRAVLAAQADLPRTAACRPARLARDSRA